METGIAAGWSDFLIAAAGAAGALAGLVFVALSINLDRILELPGVAERAAETVILLAASLLAALIVLIPGPPPKTLGLMLLAIGIPTWGLPTVIQIRDFHRRRYYKASHAVYRFFLFQIATVPILLAGWSLQGHMAGRLYWLAAFVVLAVIVALVNAWVLLVEIKR